MFCPKCNTQVADDLNFCSNCGANLKNENASMPQNQPTGMSQNPVYNQPPAGPMYNQQPPMNYQQQPSQGNAYYQQPPAGPMYNQQPGGNFQQYPNYGGQVNRPVGITLVSIYEIIFGALLVLVGLVIFSYANNSLIQLSDALGGTNYSTEFFVIGVIVILWGVLGIVGAILFLQWKNNGYVLSLIFIISSGVLLFAFYLIPLIAMIASLVYFFSNDNFKNTFNYMKNNRR